LFIYFNKDEKVAIDAYKRYSELNNGVGKENLVNVSNMNRQQIIDLLKTKGVKLRAEAEAQNKAAEQAKEL